MFVLSQSDSYSWPVEVYLPTDDGKRVKQTFDACFKRLSQSRIKEIFDKVKTEEISDLELCKEILVGWKGVEDGNGEELPFTEGAREKLLDVQIVAASVLEAFFDSLSKAKRKN